MLNDVAEQYGMNDVSQIKAIIVGLLVRMFGGMYTPLTNCHDNILHVHLQ
jgi:hypothetical protein